MSATVQYIIVFIILAIVIGWLIYKLFFKKSNKSGGCCGCGLADKCKESQKIEDCKKKRDDSRY